MRTTSAYNLGNTGLVSKISRILELTRCERADCSGVRRRASDVRAAFGIGRPACGIEISGLSMESWPGEHEILSPAGESASLRDDAAMVVSVLELVVGRGGIVPDLLNEISQ